MRASQSSAADTSRTPLQTCRDRRESETPSWCRRRGKDEWPAPSTQSNGSRPRRSRRRDARAPRRAKRSPARRPGRTTPSAKAIRCCPSACRLSPSLAHRRQGNSADLHSAPFRAQHLAALPLIFLHEVASAPTFVAAMGIEQFLPGQREIDAHVAQHQYQKVALHGLSYFEQAQGGPPLGVLAHPPPLPEADLEQSDKDQLGIDQSLDLGLGAPRALRSR